MTDTNSSLPDLGDPVDVAMPAWVIVNNGDVFEGTPEQFDDCFFSISSLVDGDAFMAAVSDWAAFSMYDVRFLGEVPAEFA